MMNNIALPEMADQRCNDFSEENVLGSRSFSPSDEMMNHEGEETSALSSPPPMASVMPYRSLSQRSKLASYVLAMLVVLIIFTLVSDNQHTFLGHTPSEEGNSEYQRVPPDENLRVVLINGCSGSNAVDDFIYNILTSHGIPVEPSSDNFEKIKPKKNPFYSSAQAKLNSTGTLPKSASVDIKMEAIKELKHDTSARNKVLMIKVSAKNDLTPTVVSALQEMNATFTYAYRWNLLDFHICRIKDCFSKHDGYTIFENGTRMELCFHRRDLDPTLKLLVHLKLKTAVNKIHKRQQEQQHHDHNISKSLMYPYQPQSTEDLFVYEYSPKEQDFQKSFEAWKQVIQPLLGSATKMREDIIEDHMRKFQNSRTPPPSHRDEIENFDDVYQAFKEADPPLDYFVRL